jgi:hypothetical protein
MDADMADPPPVEREQAEPKFYQYALARLEQNFDTSFDLFSDFNANNEQHLTFLQVNASMAALNRNTSVDYFIVDLGFCSVAAAGLVVDVIRSSSRIKTVSAHCSPL